METQRSNDEDIAAKTCVEEFFKLEEQEQKFLDAGYAYMQVRSPEWWYVNDSREVEGPYELDEMHQMNTDGYFDLAQPIMLSHWTSFYLLAEVYPDNKNAFKEMMHEPGCGDSIYTPAHLQKQASGAVHGSHIFSAGAREGPTEASEEQQTRDAAVRRYFQMVYEISRNESDWEDEDQGEEDEGEDGGMEDVEGEKEGAQEEP